MFLYPYGQNITKDLLEVLDAKGMPFMLMRKKEVLAKKLPHAVVYGILQDVKGRVLVLRTRDNTYDILHTLVRAGEARETALARVLHKRLNLALSAVMEGMPLAVFMGGQEAIEPSIESIESIEPIATQTHATASSNAMTQEEREHRAFFLVPLSAQHKEYIGQKHLGQKHLWLDFDELNGIKNHFAELLSPRLLQLLSNDYLSRLCKTVRKSS